MMAEKKRSDAIEFISQQAGLGGGRFGHGRRVVEKPKDVKKTLKRLWQYFASERKILWIIFGFVGLSSLIALGIPYLIGKGIDVIENDVIHFNVLIIIIILLVVSYLITAFLTFIQGFLVATVSQKIVLHLRSVLFAKLKNLPVSFFDRKTHGEIMSRFSNDIDNISITISSATVQLMSFIITIIGSFVMMLILSPILTIAAMATVPLIYLLTKFVTKRTQKLYVKQQTVLGQLNGQIEENITGINVVRAFNYEEKATQAFEVNNEKLCLVGTKANILSGLLMPLMNVINNLSFTLVVGAGGILAVKNLISIGTIASFVTYSKQFGRPLNNIATIFNTLQSALAGAERVFEILDENEETKDNPQAVLLENSQGNIAFSNVSFSYRSDVQIIKNITFTAKSGSRIALVGPTGAGKTTIVNLLARFYEVSSGKITIDDIDINNYTRDSLRQTFGIVLQDTYLFTGTIKDNIRYGRFDASDDAIYAAAKKACADVFIERLPNQYDTQLTESGNSLSQGQRQLIAIARAILANAPILILDEATSSVDTRTEKHIQDALLELMKGKTSFIIAHRLSTIRDCDEILVINDGQIIERGNHQYLLSLEGFYHSMYISQIKNS